MLIFFQVFGRVVPVRRPVEVIRLGKVAVQIQRVIILRVQSAGAVYGKSAAVRAGERGIQRQTDGLSAGTPDERTDDISLIEMCRCQRGIDFRVAGGVIVEPRRLGRHGYQRKHPVAAVDAQHLRDGTQLVRRVIIAAAVKIIIKTVMTVNVTVGNLIAQIVRISAGAMHYCSENVFSRH